MATVVLPNTFVAGTAAVASEVNANFTAITDQVNGALDANNLADSAVTAAKLATDAVTNVKVATGIDAVKIADGSVSNTEFQYLNGVTSAIQTQLNAKQATITGAATTIDDTDLTASRALIANASGKVAVSAVTDTELGYLDGVTSAIQTQLGGKASLAGTIYMGRDGIGAAKITPSGWGYSSDGNGTTTYTHNLGHTDYFVLATRTSAGIPNSVAQIDIVDENSFTLRSQYVTATGSGSYIAGAQVDWMLIDVS